MGRGVSLHLPASCPLLSIFLFQVADHRDEGTNICGGGWGEEGLGKRPLPGRAHRAVLRCTDISWVNVNRRS